MLSRSTCNMYAIYVTKKHVYNTKYEMAYHIVNNMSIYIYCHNKQKGK